MRKAFRFCGTALLLIVASCAGTITTTPTNKLALAPVNFADLPGWDKDQVAEAIPALQRSCTILAKKSPDSAMGIAGTAADWSPVCAELAVLPPQNDAAARNFLEHWFQPYAATNDANKDGLFTGYYEAELQGATKRHGNFQTPLYERPEDLIDVDLGDFKPELQGQHIIGKVDATKLKPYDDRAAITRGSLMHRAEVLAWVDDPIDAFFLEVQGSGRVRMNDGSVMRVGYDHANGRAYVALGRAMANMNLLEKPVTMQSIRAWLKAHPERMQEIMDLNLSYVFFREVEGDGPIGAETVALTPQRSLAVDPAYVPLGVPVWLDTQDGRGGTLQKLMVAQDTGGAIKGPVRGDFFWGAGADAEAQAGAMQNHGRYYLLLPKSVVPHVES